MGEERFELHAPGREQEAESELGRLAWVVMGGGNMGDGYPQGGRTWQ